MLKAISIMIFSLAISTTTLRAQDYEKGLEAAKAGNFAKVIPPKKSGVHG